MNSLYSDPYVIAGRRHWLIKKLPSQNVYSLSESTQVQSLCLFILSMTEESVWIGSLYSKLSWLPSGLYGCKCSHAFIYSLVEHVTLARGRFFHEINFCISRCNSFLILGTSYNARTIHTKILVKKCYSLVLDENRTTGERKSRKLKRRNTFIFCKKGKIRAKKKQQIEKLILGYHE